jgi:cytochrome b pre-mRNA-processing protein 3
MAGERQGMRGVWRRWRQRRAGARRDRDAAHALYAALVGLARRPVWYTEGGVPDTNDGRLEMIGLHVALAMRRLGREGDAGRALAQELVDLMFADIDRSLRELGVGDLSVGRKVKAIAGSFRGRAAALEAGLAAGDREALATMLLRNVYQTGPMPEPRQVLGVADGLLALDADLAATDAAALRAGRLPPGRDPL